MERHEIMEFLIDKAGLRDEEDTVLRESATVNSGIPGMQDGPADAYRHILLAAELTRRFGEARARIILEANEQLAGGDGPETGMDRINNEPGIRLGKRVKTWAEAVQGGRDLIEEGLRHGGDGTRQNGRVRRIANPPASAWASGWRTRPLVTGGRSKFGGPQHRYDAAGQPPIRTDTRSRNTFWPYHLPVSVAPYDNGRCLPTIAPPKAMTDPR